MAQYSRNVRAGFRGVDSGGSAEERALEKEKQSMKRWTGILVSILAVCLSLSALASGVEYDSDGGVWDYNKGTYTTSDGKTVSIIDEDASTKTVRNADGSVTIITNEKDIIQNPDGSITLQNGQVMTVQTPEDRAAEHEKGWTAGMAKAAAVNGTYTPTFYTDMEGNETEVPVSYIGTGRSMITLEGQKVLVDTSSLRWETEAPADKVIAVVNKSTYAKLHSKKDSKSLVMDKVPYGQILRVVNTGKHWTFVDYKGIRGYIATSYLTFYANEKPEYQTGVIATRAGKTKGTITVHVRNKPNGKQQEEYTIGTPITILGIEGDWAKIEVEGHSCYIKKEFIVFD